MIRPRYASNLPIERNRTYQNMYSPYLCGNSHSTSPVLCTRTIPNRDSTPSPPKTLLSIPSKTYIIILTEGFIKKLWKFTN